MTDQPTAPGLRELMAQARRWHMAFNSAKRSMTGEHQVACSGPDCEFCLFAASVMTRSPRKQLEERDTAALTPAEKWFAVYCDEKPYAAYPTRKQAEVYASGFSKPTEIREVGEAASSPLPEIGQLRALLAQRSCSACDEARDLLGCWAASSTLTPAHSADAFWERQTAWWTTLANESAAAGDAYNAHAYRTAAHAIRMARDRAAEASVLPPSCRCGTTLVCPDLGCDSNKTGEEASVLPISPQEKKDEEVARRDGHTLTDRREDSR